MKAKYFTFLILSYCTRSEAQTWNLLWSDEFDRVGINTSTWTYDTGGGGWGNNELQYYTNRVENALIENGNLLIVARKESYAGKSYTSARLKTEGLKSFTYGKIEARIKLPVGQGLWPAFWMLGNSRSQVGWPRCGEIDIMEHINHDPNIFGTLHWDKNGYISSGGKTLFGDTSKYHIYSVEWRPDSIIWYFDGIRYWELNIANNINSTEEFHLPFFIILNVAVGGIWPGNPDSTTPFPDTMYVDYVRVYQRATTGVQGNLSRVPNHFTLEQNYPNPFNPSTTIRFDLSARSFVTLKVFDLLGREITTLINEEKPAGSFQITWDASGVPSGVYFYRVYAGSFVQTREMILLK